MTEEQIKAKAKEQFPNDEFDQQIVIDAINWATKELQEENEKMKAILNSVAESNTYADLLDAKKKAKELLNKGKGSCFRLYQTL